MVGGGMALCILVTLCFGWFIFWGRSASGQKILRQTLGEPLPRPKAKSTLTGGQERKPRSAANNVIAKGRKVTLDKSLKEETNRSQGRSVKTPVKAAEILKGEPVTRRQAEVKGRKRT